MSRRMIPCQVTDEYVRGDRVVVGAAGSHNDVALRLVFGPMWEGTARSIVWKDALGGNPTITILGTDLLEDGETEVYIVPIPAEPKAYAGDLSMTIKGAVVDGDTETSATLTARAFFTVMESDWDEDAAESGDITPSQAEQLQAQLEAIKTDIASSAQAAADAAASASAAAQSESSAQRHADEADNGAKLAAHSAADAAASASAAETAANDAKYYANEAWSGARTATDRAEAAGNSASAAGQSAAAASSCEAAAEACKAAAAASQEAAARSETQAEYWAKQAEATVGGDFATEQEARKYVSDHNESEEAHADLREKVDSKASATHASQHAAVGDDPIIPESIGAVKAGQNTDVWVEFGSSDGEGQTRIDENGITVCGYDGEGVYIGNDYYDTGNGYVDGVPVIGFYGTISDEASILRNVADPVYNIDAANKRYVDAAVSGAGILPVKKGGTGFGTIEDTTYTTARYRASALVSAETDPSTNGVINWIYE